MGLRAADRLLAAIPFSHSYGFTTLALSALVRGLTLVVPADRGPFSSLAAARGPGRDCVSDGARLHSGAAEAGPPAGLARAAFGSSFRPAPCCPAPRRRSSGRLTGSRCTSSTERASAAASATTAKEARPSEAPSARRSTAFGCRWRAADQEVPRGGRRGRGIARRRRDLPAGAGFAAAGRSFETSDVGVWHGDELVLRRRVDRVINVRGRKVDPGEVERVLADARRRGRGRRHRQSPGPDGDEIVRAVVACPLGPPQLP